MEFVGRRVRKEVLGFGVCFGLVKFYNLETGYFEVKYENGDSEELDLSQVASILEEQSASAAAAAAEVADDTIGRKPKRRRKNAILGDSGNDSGNLVTDSSSVGGKTLEEDLGVLNGNVDINANWGDDGVDLNDGSNLKNGLDLNVSLDDAEHIELINKEGLKSGELIDLNVYASEEDDLESKPAGYNVDIPKKEHCFDLNFGVDDEMKYSNADENQVKGFNVSTENLGVNLCPNDLDGDSTGTMARTATFGFLDANFVNESGSSNNLLMGPSNASTAVVNYEGNVESTFKGNSKKSRKVLESATKAVLRRSGRTRRAAISVQQNFSPVIGLDEVKDELVSPAVSAVSEEKIIVSGCEELEGRHILPPKPQLPPSSANLNVDGIPIFDLFSVYSFLRSFSTLLFLSPFELDDFVAALRCKAPTLLLDYIHLSLLQTLRKHLESLSDESSESASICLRSLDWNYLDLVTWPIFMVEYLLMHSSLLSPGSDQSRLKLFESDYYKQSASVKIEMLRCLCDDVNEVEIIRSELTRRTLAMDPSMDFDRKMTPKKRAAVMDVSGTSCSTEEVVDETTDWNSDECYLCKMDGSLICCDGCPAAFHSRCVGLVSTLLPEGDWYCPECTIDRHNPWTRLRKSIRGAELLGIDSYDRQYYNSCGYLLVSDSGDMESPFRYYNRNDLTFVIEAIKSPHIFYSTLLSAVMKFWNVSAKVKSDTGPQTVSDSIDYIRKGIEVLEPVVVDDSMNIGKPIASSEGSAEISQAITNHHNLRNSRSSKRYSGILNDSEISGILNDSKITEKPVYDGDCPLSSTNQEVEVGKNVQLADHGNTPSNVDTTVDMPQGQCGTNYVNLYSFARTASSVAETLLRKSSDKISKDSRKSVEEMISTQLRVVSNIPTEFCWSNIRNLDFDSRKEKCGWCFSCKVPEDGGDCLFIIKDTSSFLNNFTSDLLGIRPSKNWKGHLIDVMCHILCIEDRLHGLLLGPWLNSQYSNIWRKAVYKASDVASLKHFLVMLESNLHIRAFSAEWHRQVDSAMTVGSASHIVTSSLRLSSKNGISRRRASCPDSESSPPSNAGSGLGLFWWRGGRISRELFKWKVLPRSLASKAARQAGSKKIYGIVYSDSSEFAKRSKYVAWRASVEASSSVEQLALQVRELDANIKWDAIENTKLLSKTDKEFGKLIRSFKKVIIRRKCSEGTVGKYLLDFGKRRFIPDVVVKHGSLLEESLSDRRKYWLEESYVPLHLVKAFEEKRIARKINKTSSTKLHENGIEFKKLSKKTGFSYLFSKAERSEYCHCGHCNKDVLIRDAVSCEYCEGFFHKRHVRKYAGAITAECTYTCHKCLDRTCVKIDTKKGKRKLQKGKKASKIKRPVHPKISTHIGKDKQLEQRQSKNKNSVVVPLRRSARKVKLISRHSEKIGGIKQGQQTTSRKWKPKTSKKTKKPKKQKKGTCQKKRTLVCHSYWLNGLWLSRKPNHERRAQFGSEKLLVDSKQLNAILDKPKCSLCREPEYTSALNYIGCEMCGDWFHGDAFGLGAEKIGYLIGFKCHKCRDRAPPECPHMHAIRTDEGQLGRSSAAGVGSDADISNSPAFSNEEQHVGNDPGFLQTIVRDTESEHINISLEQTTEATHDCKEKSWRSPDELMELSESNSFEDISLEMGEGRLKVTTLAKMDFPLVKFNVDVTGKKLTSSVCNNGSLEAATLLGSAVNQNPVGASGLPTEATTDSEGLHNAEGFQSNISSSGVSVKS